MPIQVIDGFQINTGLPVDNRIVASGSAARDAIPYKYEGLRVFDTSDGIPYVWINNSWSSENSTGVSGVSTTANYIPKYNSSNVVGNSVIYQTPSTNRIGINTTSPGYTFEVNGDISVVGSGNSFRGVGSGITQINANNITTGNLALGQLSNGTPGHVLVGGTTNPVYLNPNQLTVGTSSYSTNSLNSVNLSLTYSTVSSTNYLAMFENTTTGPVRKNTNIYFDSVSSELYINEDIRQSVNTFHDVFTGNGWVALGKAGGTSFSDTIKTVTLTVRSVVYIEATFVSRIVENARGAGYTNGVTKIAAAYHMNTSGAFSQIGSTSTVFSQANTVGTTTAVLGTPTINTSTNYAISFNQTGSATNSYNYYLSVNYKIIVNEGY